MLWSHVASPKRNHAEHIFFLCEVCCVCQMLLVLEKMRWAQPVISSFARPVPAPCSALLGGCHSRGQPRAEGAGPPGQVLVTRELSHWQRNTSASRTEQSRARIPYFPYKFFLKTNRNKKSKEKTPIEKLWNGNGTFQPAAAEGSAEILSPTHSRHKVLTPYSLSLLIWIKFVPHSDGKPALLAMS